MDKLEKFGDKFLKTRHFQQNAHASGMRIKSSQTLACTRETRFHSLNHLTHHWVLPAFIFFVLPITACGRLPHHSILISSEGDSLPSQSRLNLNTATLAELQTMPGIGKVLAKRIIDHRNQYGKFRRSEHLMMVRGISERKFQELKPFITVD